MSTLSRREPKLVTIGLSVLSATGQSGTDAHGQTSTLSSAPGSATDEAAGLISADVACASGLSSLPHIVEYPNMGLFA